METKGSFPPIVVTWQELGAVTTSRGGFLFRGKETKGTFPPIVVTWQKLGVVTTSRGDFLFRGKETKENIPPPRFVIAGRKGRTLYVLVLFARVWCSAPFQISNQHPRYGPIMTVRTVRCLFDCTMVIILTVAHLVSWERERRVTHAHKFVVLALVLGYHNADKMDKRKSPRFLDGDDRSIDRFFCPLSFAIFLLLMMVPSYSTSFREILYAIREIPQQSWRRIQAKRRRRVQSQKQQSTNSLSVCMCVCVCLRVCVMR